MFAILDDAFPVMELFNGVEERSTRKVVGLLHFNNIYTEVVRANLKSVTLCSRLLREGSDLIIQNIDIMKGNVVQKKGRKHMKVSCTEERWFRC